MMGYSSDLNRVGKYLDSLVEEYKGLYIDACEKGVNEDKIYYSAFVDCIDKLNRDLFFPSDFEGLNVVRELLMQNYGNCDSRIECVDGSSFVVGFDDLCDVVDGFVVIRNKEEFEEDCTVVPSIVRVVNLDCIKSVECVPIEFGFSDLKLK